ncbi:MAG: hypothetical protein ACI9XP_001965 [Lentimonas sp.]|jgi:hypothetical protein
MIVSSLKDIKSELKNATKGEVEEICLRLIKHKKENKELINYLLYYQNSHDTYIEETLEEMHQDLTSLNTDSYFYMKKTIRKALNKLKKNIRFSQSKEVEIHLLMAFCKELKQIKPSIFKSTVLRNLYDRQINAVEKALTVLPEDLQYDYRQEIESLIH